MDKTKNVAVVGATGLLGKELLQGLFDRKVPAQRVVVLASERSRGSEVDYGDETLEVEALGAGSFRNVSVAFFATPPEVTSRFGKAARQAGAKVVDSSGAFLENEEATVFLPGVNDGALGRGGEVGLVCCAGVLASGLCPLLEPLWASGIEEVVGTALLPASRAGLGGVAELERQTRALFGGQETEPGRFSHRLGFNVIPGVGPFVGPDSGEEAALTRELAGLWRGRPEHPRVRVTALWAPLFFGVVLSLSLRLGRATSLGELGSTLSGSRRLKVLDDPKGKVFPMPMLVTGDPAVHVGRIRAGEGGWVHLVAAWDNIGTGGALNALAAFDLLGSAEG